MKLVEDRPTDRPTDIATYRAAIAAKKEIRSRPPNSGRSDIFYLARYKFTFSNNYTVL